MVPGKVILSALTKRFIHTFAYGYLSHGKLEEKGSDFKSARIVKPEGMFVKEDPVAKTLQRCKDQLPKLKQVKEA